MSAKPIPMSLKKFFTVLDNISSSIHPTLQDVCSPHRNMARGGGLVTHWRHNLLPPAEPSGLVPVVFASLSFSHLSSFSFFFFSVLVILSLFFLFSPLGLASAAKSTSGITASSSFFFFCVLVSWFSFSLCFISPGLRSQRTYSAQLVNDCRSKCTGDLLPSDTTRATTPVNISTNSGKPPFFFFFFLKRCANVVRDETQVLLQAHVRFFFCLILNTRVF